MLRFFFFFLLHIGIYKLCKLHNTLNFQYYITYFTHIMYTLHHLHHVLHTTSHTYTRLFLYLYVKNINDTTAHSLLLETFSPHIYIYKPQLPTSHLLNYLPCTHPYHSFHLTFITYNYLLTKVLCLFDTFSQQIYMFNPHLPTSYLPNYLLLTQIYLSPYLTLITLNNLLTKIR